MPSHCFGQNNNWRAMFVHLGISSCGMFCASHARPRQLGLVDKQLRASRFARSAIVATVAAGIQPTKPDEPAPRHRTSFTLIRARRCCRRCAADYARQSFN
ncbi:hypothetical protein CBL_05378 [Carabus blaptoides fortunei]